MARQAVTVTGAEEAARAFRSLGDDLVDFGDVNRRAVDLIGSAARRAAPRRTGRLRASITGQADETRATVTATVRYARPQEALTHYLNGAIRRTEDKRRKLYDDYLAARVAAANRSRRP